MATCFVMQPFDKGKYDKRFSDVFEPAIKAAELEAYRVDKDLNVLIPIDSIEKGIQDSTICFAEISTDNPNVWFELGYAISAGKEVVMVCCNKERTTPFPFDIRHRSIITHENDSSSDFDDLRKRITAKLKALMTKAENIQQLSEAVLKEVEGLEHHEMIALATTAENLDSPNDFVGAHTIRTDMGRGGFTKLATALALKTLTDKQFIQDQEVQPQNWNEQSYTTYTLTAKGWAWLNSNKAKLLLRKHQHVADNDVPF